MNSRAVVFTALWPRAALGIAALVAVLLPVHPCFAQTNFATLISDGAYTWFSDPRAVFYNGALYFGYTRASDSRAVLSAFNLSSGQTTNLWASSLTQHDDHNHPGLLVKSDGRMLAVWSRHGSDQFFSYRLSASTNPVTAADWGAEQTIANSGAGVTYANPYQLSAESGKIYNFCRDLNYNPTVFTSTNGGTNWSSPQLFIRTGSGSTRPYVKYASNYTNRIDVLYTDGHPRDVANSLYHIYYSGGAIYKTDGSLLKSYSSLPLLHDSGERGSVIYQYSDADTSDPNDHIPTGRAWCWEIAYQTNGDPACVFSVQRDLVTGPTQGTDDRIYYYYARWTGAAWQKRFIAQAGRPLYSAENDYAGGICLDPQDVNTIYLSSNAQNPFSLADTTNVTLRANSRYEIWRGTTADGGLTFSWQQITTNSTLDNIRPYVPRRNGGENCLIWLRGTYTSYTSYALSIVGLFTTQVPQTNAASGVWNVDADGVWSDNTKWLNGIVGTGAGNTADFSALDITADRTVTLDALRTLGTLRFGDTSGGQNWFVNSGGGTALTLNSGSSVVPSIVVNSNNATLQVTLAGTNGFTKSGIGTLILASSNSLTGALNLDRGIDGNNNDGATRITSSSAIQNFSAVNIRNTSVTTAGGATLQLDGTAGGIVVTQNISATCRNNSTVPTFESLAGTNTLAGTNCIQVGGTNVIYQSDAGSLLQITAPIQYVGTLTSARTFTFTGAGDIAVSGAILASSNAAPSGVMKTGGGTLTLSGANTYTNGTVVLSGILNYNGSVNTGRVTVASGTLGGTGTIGGAVTIQSGGTLAPGSSGIGTLTINNALTNTGTVFIRLNKSGATLTNSIVKGVSNFSIGGTLSVSNVGTGIVTVGDSFKLFSATNATGSFAAITPATPGVGLKWNTNTLAANGILSVVLGTVHPQMTQTALSGTNLVFGGNGGAAGYNYSVLTTTNLAVPFSAWNVAGGGTFDAGGNFNFTNAMDSNSTQKFYVIQIP